MFAMLEWMRRKSEVAGAARIAEADVKAAASPVKWKEEGRIEKWAVNVD